MDLVVNSKMERFGSGKLCSGASDCSDTCRDTRRQDQNPSGRSSPAANCVCVDDLTPHLRCGLCREHVAGSLVLSCGHLYCGQCLVDHLAKAAPACPTCQMTLRAVPVRCIAIDHVVAALLAALTPAEQDAYRRRKERGESAPSIIAKMLWWLEAGAPAPGGAAEPSGGAALGGGGAGGMLMQQHGVHQQMAMSRARAAAAAAAAAGSGAVGTRGKHHHQHSPAAAVALGSGSAQTAPPSAQISAAASAAAAHDAAMTAAMTAAAAAAAVASGAPAPYGMPQLGSMGMMGMTGAGMGPIPGIGLGGLGAGMLGIQDPHLQLSDAAVYGAALQSMQTVAALQAAMPGGYHPSRLGGLM